MAQQVQPVRIGADVDSRFIQIAYHERREGDTIDNRPGAIRAWLRRQSAPAALAVEATGPYHQALVEQAHAHGITVYLINPFQLHHYRQGIGQRHKTDRADARLLARYLAHEEPELRPWTPPPPGQRQAWQLLKRRAQVVRARTLLTQSLADVEGVDRQIRAVQRRFEALESALEHRVHELLRQAGWQHAYRRCRSIPGLGSLSAAALVLAYHRGPFPKADSLVAFLGLDIRVRESGRHVGHQKLTKQGDAEYRRLLHNAAR
ncbi:ISPpu10, transposase, partial [Salinisphaera sp. PC39]|uniref:IS110 family transposase n=1 Tax=Salinisphaera sp. PC39 TaxID=1304156 RepID=UPI00333E6FB0